MIVSALTQRERQSRLRNPGLALRTGPFVFRIISPIASIDEGLALLYADYELAEEAEFVDYTVVLEPVGGLRRWYKPQVRFSFDGKPPFEALPLDHAFPLLEWAMNWCIAGQAHYHLLLHAAVIERDGLAAIMPAPPGSGKSTLCAGLVNRGWRLLSDEMTIIALDTRQIIPLGRPISLKNQSIEVIRAFAPDVVFNRISHETNKGSVTHAKVPPQHLARLAETATARWVVFPKYVAGAPATMAPHSSANSLLELGRNAFNYMVLGAEGFEVLADVVSGCDCFDFSYSNLDEAVLAFDALVHSSRE